MEVASTTNSEENSQMDATDPILPLAVPSSPKTPIGIPKSRGRPPKFSPRAKGSSRGTTGDWCVCSQSQQGHGNSSKSAS